MLFYVSLFLFSIAVAAIALWFYRSLYEIGKATYQAIFPNAREKYGDVNARSLDTTVNEVVSPWGWSGDRGPRRAIPQTATPAKPTSASPAPWGWKGSSNQPASASSRMADDVAKATQSLKRTIADRNKSDDPVVGWPYREENFQFGGTEYKVTRKKRVKKTNVAGTTKPWGW